MKKRTFTPAFKKEAVALVNEQGYTIAKAAVSLGINDRTLRGWVVGNHQQSESELNEGERAELKRLRKENKELRLEKDILKKASAFFAKHMS